MKTEKEIHDYLIEQGFTDNNFGVILVQQGATVSNLTVLVAEAIKDLTK
mgnify:CR=1 FL=1